MTAAGAPALPQTCYPAVWLWPGQALYAGPSLRLEPHSGAAWCLVVGADREVTVTAGRQRIVARSVLIPPRTVHHLDTAGGRLVSCYLDPSSDRASGCQRRFRCSAGEFATDHVDADALTRVPTDDVAAQRWLDLAAPASPRRLDPRIGDVLARMGSDAVDAPSARSLATELGVSESRLLHLFRGEAGTSLRQYRLWMRLIRAGVALSAGKNLTEAAVEAGFASPSHLADRFKATFGLTASQLLGSGTVVRVPGSKSSGAGPSHHEAPA